MSAGLRAQRATGRAYSASKAILLIAVFKGYRAPRKKGSNGKIKKEGKRGGKERGKRREAVPHPKGKSGCGNDESF